MEKDRHIGPDDKVYSYLMKLGYSEQEIVHMSTNTRLFHDLGVYGDAAEDAIWLLEKKFGVGLSEFQFDRYFPPEFEGRNKFDAFVRNIATPRESRLINDRGKYEPLTLGMLNSAILATRWMVDTNDPKG
jgi:hypothetical protein